MELASSVIVLFLLTGRASGLMEFEDDLSFNETDEEVSGGSNSGSQELEEDALFNETVDEVSGGSASGSGLQDDRTFYHHDNFARYIEPVEATLMDFFPEMDDRRKYISVGNPPIIYHECSYESILDHLSLSRNKVRFQMIRPVKNHTTATEVKLVMAIAAILDVRETDQTFVAYIWIHMVWNNDFIHWNPAQFCDIEHVLIPTSAIWKPDIIIEEMIEKDKAPPSEFLKIRSNGEVEYRNDLVVLSTCKMRVYQFPFDIQKCTISFKSLMHSDEELYFIFSSNTTRLTELSRTVMQTQYEWLFLKMTVTSKTDSMSIDSNQTSVIHTIYMKRRSLLYIANFLMPVLFFLCLDLSSFLISDSGGEKLSFKVTVLLAVTVMQLILNEILPCSSERIPLIALFCIGIFALMMLSLLQTILVMHLMEKDAASAQDNETNRDQLMKNQHSKFNIHHCFKEIYGRCMAASDEQADRKPCVVKEDSRSQLTEVSVALGKVSDELEQIEKSMTALSEVKKDGYWTRLAKKINKVFIVFYLVAVTMFLIVIFTFWSLPDEEE